MIPLIIESDNTETIIQYLTDKYYLQNLVGEVKPEGEGIGLPAIKYLIDRAKFSRPDKSQAVFLIWDGHLITPVGQNALLKTLEESRPYEQFVITTHSHHLLLDTIISRCQVISLAKTAKKTIDKNILLTFVSYLSSPAESIKSSDQILADDPKSFLRQVIDNLRQANRNLPTIKRVEILSRALVCLSDLDRNINSKLAIDHFLFQSHKIIKKST